MCYKSFILYIKHILNCTYDHVFMRWCSNGSLVVVVIVIVAFIVIVVVVLVVISVVTSRGRGSSSRNL